LPAHPYPWHQARLVVVLQTSATRTTLKTATETDARDRAGLWLCLPLLAGLYLPFIGGGLLTDDYAHVERLSDINGVAQLVGTPDTFQFYRPLTQASLALDIAVYGRRAARFRVVNVVLHAGVIGLAFVVARLVLASPLAAWLATLTFALTPKAHPIAVLWISARAELLMSIFSLAAVAAWIVWTRNGRPRWLMAAAGAYVLALLSKETATLLPLLLFVTPRPQRPLTARATAVVALLALAAVIYAWRSHVGALTPLSGDVHYDLLTPLTRWARSARNYTSRMVAAPLGLVAVLAIARLAARGRFTVRPVRRESLVVAVFSLGWMLVFLAPVLPIVARSELYLYLPVFGVCLLAGSAADALMRGIERKGFVLAAVGLYVVALGAYQGARGLEIHRDLVFSEKLVAALQGSADLAGREGAVVLVPSDATTERFLQDSIGGYLHIVLQHAFGSERLTGAVQYQGTHPTSSGLRLICEYRLGRVTLRRADPLT